MKGLLTALLIVTIPQVVPLPNFDIDKIGCICIDPNDNNNENSSSNQTNNGNQTINGNQNTNGDQNINSNETKKYRLPSIVKPIYYTIKLVPNITEGTFYGETNIKIDISANGTKTIILHAKGLNFDETYTHLVGADNISVRPFNQTIDKETDFLTLYFSDPGINAGHYTLYLRYNGKLNDQLEGFYRASYINELGQKTWFAATHFSPSNARRVFPCFDEPAMKAKFEIIIWALANRTVISNMPSVGSNSNATDEDSLKPNHFQVTPVMSAYDVAFVISDFVNKTSDGNKLSFWSRRNTTNMGSYAQSIAKQSIVLFENYTNFELVLPTIDNVALPAVQSGVKGGWGLITYAEREIFFQANVTSTKAKQQIALMMSGEIARQWFGGLVSASWWSFTWVNEGLSNFFQYFIANQIETSWRLMDQYVIKNLQETTFIADAKKTSQALNTQVNGSVADINSHFANVSSSKAGSIIRMFSHALGPQVLRSGLKAYVKKYAFGSASADDFFAILESAKGVPENIDIKGALDSWAKQPGYPVVTVVRRYYYREAGVEKEYMDHSFTQARYYAQKMNTTATAIWSIPITFTTEDERDFNNTLPYQWVNTTTSPGHYPGVTANKWIIYNKQQIGCYRVNYDLTNWSLLAKYLNTTNYNKIHVLNRAQLVDDSFNLVQSGHLTSHKVFLEISRYLEREDDYIPWNAGFRAFSVLNKALVNTENYQDFKIYVLRLIEKFEKSVGYEEVNGETHMNKLARVNVIDWACKMGSKNCTSATLKLLTQHIAGSKKISTDLRKVVLSSGIRTADEGTWNKTFAYYLRTKNSSERKDLISALGCSSNTEILKSYLAKTQNSQYNITLDEAIKAVITGSESGVDVTLDFIKENSRSIIGGGENNQAVLGYVIYIANSITVEAQSDKLERFINSLIAEHADLAVALSKRALPRAISNIEWSGSHGTQITQFMREQHHSFAQNIISNVTDIIPPFSNAHDILPPISDATDILPPFSLIHGI